MLRTRITDEYGLEVPIISAGMAFVAGPPLAIAVSEAGGMGTLGGVMVPPAGLREMIQAVRSGTSRPFGLDLITDFVEDDHIAVCVDEKVPVVVFFWESPRPEHVRALRAAGTRVWMQVGSVEQARTMTEIGIDAVVVQGSEGGGHNRSTASTFNLVPAVVDSVAPVPVVAAGGIVDGRGVVAALALGADAVWCGTRFLASVEADAHDQYKSRVVQASVGDTIRTTLFGPEWPGQPVRVLRNRVVRQWAGHEAEAARDPSAMSTIGRTTLGGDEVPMPKFSAILPTPAASGDFEEMCLTMGESGGNIPRVESAGAIVRHMADEAADIIRLRLTGILPAVRSGTREPVTP